MEWNTHHNAALERLLLNGAKRVATEWVHVPLDLVQISSYRVALGRLATIWLLEPEALASATSWTNPPFEEGNTKTWCLHQVVKATRREACSF